jgi:hypothetical protein
MMENQRIAKFFLGAILGQTVEDLSVLPQEFTYKLDDTDVSKKLENETEKKEDVRYYSFMRQSGYCGRKGNCHADYNNLYCRETIFPKYALSLR